MRICETQGCGRPHRAKGKCVICYERDRSKQLRAQAKDLLGGFCVHCLVEGAITAEGLEFDHVDPKTKLFTIAANATSVSKEAFWLEVAKCQLLCRPHHEIKSAVETSGEENGKSKLTETDVKTIRNRHEIGQSLRVIARDFGVGHAAIYDIVHGITWKSV